MPEMMLYHGSRDRIEMPMYGKGNKYNDYGLGFYCTESVELAKEWAVAEGRDGFANRYSLEMTGLNVMHLQLPEYHILNWLALLLKNRDIQIQEGLPAEAMEYIVGTFLPDTSKADIIIGYRADDSYFSFARAFLNNTISLDQLRKAMHLGKLGEQIVLITQQSFDRIRFLDAEIAERKTYLPLKQDRDLSARKVFRAERRQGRSSHSTYVLDILREEWMDDDPRLR